MSKRGDEGKDRRKMDRHIVEMAFVGLEGLIVVLASMPTALLVLVAVKVW